MQQSKAKSTPLYKVGQLFLPHIQHSRRNNNLVVWLAFILLVCVGFSSNQLFVATTMYHLQKTNGMSQQQQQQQQPLLRNREEIPHSTVKAAQTKGVNVSTDQTRVSAQKGESLKRATIEAVIVKESQVRTTKGKEALVVTETSSSALEKKNEGENQLEDEEKMEERLATPDSPPLGTSLMKTANESVAPVASTLKDDELVADMGVPEKLQKYDISCGCPRTCDAVALQRQSKAYSCIKRISYVMSQYKANEMEACMAATTGGSPPCGLECHPIHCHNETALIKPKSLNWTSVVTIERPQEPFVRYDKVVMATKVLWPNDLFRLKQMICLFTAAYNRRVNYDIVVFSTVSWTRQQVRELQSVAPQTSIRVVLDSPPLQDQLATMSTEEIEFLYKRCGVEEGQNITWFHHCSEPGYGNAANLGYSWQSEFRAYHIWKTPVLSDYKYMIWMDSDAFCTKPWTRDPIKVMVENDLVLLFDNFPQGFGTNPKLKDKLMRAYNRSFCNVFVTNQGHFRPRECDGPNGTVRIGQVHGFHHITNLDFYRNTSNLRFLELLVEDYRFSRQWDDQIGVTIPAAMDAPERAWDYRTHGMNMGIHHNGNLDGKEKNIAFGYNVFWKKLGKKNWEAAREMCDDLVVHGD